MGKILVRLKQRAARDLTKWLMPDRIVIHRQFKEIMGCRLNLDNPVTFSEKIQWLKLSYRRSHLPRLADKYEVRQYVRDRVGEQVLNRLLHVWEDVRDIDVAKLPNRFVIKATHGSGMNLICHDKRDVDWGERLEVFRRWLRRSYYYPTREWVYRDIKPRLICEAYLGDGAVCPDDYKVFCFNGEPKVIQVDQGRDGNRTRTMFDLGWNKLPFELHYPASHHVPEEPKNLKDMLNVARALSAGLPFCRVDLYSVEGRAIFGELTMYPGNGMAPFRPVEWDQRLGDWLELPK